MKLEKVFTYSLPSLKYSVVLSLPHVPQIFKNTKPCTPTPILQKPLKKKKSSNFLTINITPLMTILSSFLPVSMENMYFLLLRLTLTSGTKHRQLLYLFISFCRLNFLTMSTLTPTHRLFNFHPTISLKLLSLLTKDYFVVKSNGHLVRTLLDPQFL